MRTLSGQSPFGGLPGVAIAPSFGDIFFSNSLKNGLLPIKLDHEIVASIMTALREQQGATIGVDLAAQTVTDPTEVFTASR